MKKTAVIFGIILVFSLNIISIVAAQETNSSHVAVILVMDNSGSMESNDPQGLRFTAAQLFVSLLDQGDSVGLIQFSTQSHPLTDGLITIQDVSHKQDLVELLQPNLADGYTDVKAAFDAVQTMLAGENLENRETVVVFLTDGKPEIPQPYAEYNDEAISLIEQLDIPVMSIALTPAAKTPFLNRVAAKTEGVVIPAQNASNLLDAYLNIFSQLKDRTLQGEGSINAPGETFLELHPALAPYIDRVSFVVSKPESVNVTLYGPDNQEINPNAGGIAFALDAPDFSVITLENPAGGAWKYELKGGGQVQVRAILHSRLRLQLDLPQNVYEAGQPVPITVRLVEEKVTGERVNILGEANFSATIIRPDGQQDSLDQFYDDGSHGDTQPGDGRYTRLYNNTQEQGTYNISIQGWKGVIPVEAQTHFEAILFPNLSVDEPEMSRYLIREEGVPLQIHLEGGEISELDGGTILALITTPRGLIAEVNLEESQPGHYEGSYLPSENGTYEVAYTPQRADYQGLPYTHTAQVGFEAQIISQVLVLETELNLGRIELQEAQQGLMVEVPVKSNSTEVVPLNVTLEGMTAYTLLEKEPIMLPPQEEVILNFHLTRQVEVTVGEMSGRLLFSTPEEVDVVPFSLPITAEIFQPTIRVEGIPDTLTLTSVCDSTTKNISLALISTSQEVENLEIRVGEESSIQIHPNQFEVAPNSEKEITLEIIPKDTLSPGVHDIQLGFYGRQGVVIEPRAAYSFQLQVQSFWVSCRKPLIWGGFFSVLALLGIISIMRRIKRASAPPAVTGTLRYWKSGKRSERRELDLTALTKSEISIGSGIENDLVIQDSSLAVKHFIIAAENKDDEIQILLKPLGKLNIGYRVLQNETELNHEDKFSIGNWTFLYLSDEGW